MKEENKVKKDKEKTEYSYTGSGGIKFSGSARVTMVIAFYKRNYWLLIVSSLVVLLLALTSFFFKPFWSSIINLVVGIGALFGIPYWRVKNIVERTSS